jgi:hypothetical protein
MRSLLLVAIASGLLCLGCARAEKYELDQEIEMGPFTFSVQSARMVIGSGHPRLDVDLFLRNDSGVDIEFADYFNDLVDIEGNKNSSMRLSPRMKVVDIHGHGFVGAVKYETAEFIIWEVRLRDEEEFNEQHSNMETKDFRIAIKNPDPQKGQPRMVSVQLK